MQPDEAVSPEGTPAPATPPEAVGVEETPLTEEESQAARQANHRAVAEAAKLFLLEQAAVPPKGLGVAARRRAAPLVAKPLLSEEERQAAREARQELKRAKVQPALRSVLEKKLVGLHDAQEMLQVMNTELALQRAQRLHGDEGGSRQTLRVLTVVALFALLISALGAMSWLQDRFARTGFSRHRADAVSQK